MKHRTLLIAFGFLVLTGIAAGVSAATIYTTYKLRTGDTLQSVAAKYATTTAAIVAMNPSIRLASGQALNVGYVQPVPTSTSATQSATTSTTSQTPVTASGESRFIAYTTAYGWPDNTPPGSSAISNPILHTVAGGSGTYVDPITLAVGHSILNGNDTLDYPAGTRFYIPNLRRYFIVEDTCGDGSTPQNGPCHTGFSAPAVAWVDMWVGGSQGTASAVLACEDAVTGNHLIVENPASNYVAMPGSVYGTSCTQQYGDTIVTQ